MALSPYCLLPLTCGVEYGLSTSLLQRYMAYLAGAEEADEDYSDFGDKAGRVWDMAQSGVKGAIRLGYKRHRNLAYEDEPLDLQLAAATYLTNEQVAIGVSELTAAMTAFYVCISRGSKDKREALEQRAEVRTTGMKMRTTRAQLKLLPGM